VGESYKLDQRTEQEIHAYQDFLADLNEKNATGDPRFADLGELDERYHYILEHLRAITVDIAPDGRVAYVSPSVTAVMGYEPVELIGEEGFPMVHPGDMLQAAEGARQLREEGAPYKADFRARHKDGRWIWLEVSAARAYQPTTGRAFTVIFARDISDLKRAGEALIDSESRLRALMEHASDIIAEVDSEGRVHYLSPNFETVLGRKIDEIMGRTFVDAGIADNLHPDDAAELTQLYQRTLGAGDAAQNLLAYRFRHADGSWRWFESQTTPYRTQSGELREVIVSRDVTERVQAEVELRESEERHRILGESSRDLIAELDANGDFLFVSPGSEAILGYSPEELIGSTGIALVHPDDVESNTESFLEALKDCGPVRSEPYRVRHRDGSWRWVEGVGVPYRRADGELRILTVTRDVTERIEGEEQRRELEDRMRHAQKLEGLGVMAGGIAHDFNNLLTPILGNASLALLDLPTGSPARQRIEKIHSAALRAAALTNQMLAYAGSGHVAADPQDLSRIVSEITQLFDASIPSQTTVVYSLDPNLPMIAGDDAQLSQIVMNLLTNAVEALGDGKGQITVATGTTQIDTAFMHGSTFGVLLPAGTYVHLEVSDTGCGMDQETRSRIFDPFFTTKFTGRGLGLAAVLGVVRGHGGAIEIESEPGRGTCFRVLFPRATGESTEAVAETVSAEDWHGSGTVLVVDDDEGVLDLAGETLRRAGMTVLTAGNGREGIEVFIRHRDEIDAVFLDRTMPDISGEDAFDEIRRVRPDARVVLVSGYSEEHAARNFEARDLVGFLQKPFRTEMLIKKLRDALDA